MILTVDLNLFNFDGSVEVVFRQYFAPKVGVRFKATLLNVQIAKIGTSFLGRDKISK